MNTQQLLRATLAVTALGLASTSMAQVSADKLGKSTSGNTPSATPVTPGAVGHAMGDDPAYGRYWSAMDANNDGKVTRDEYLAYHGSRYDKYDTGKRGYYDRQSLRNLYVEREMSKTDGHPAGTPLNSTTKK